MTTAANSVRASTAPVTTDAVLRLEVTGDTWVEVTADGQPVFAQTLRKGEFKSFKGKNEVVIFIARAGAAQITANGRILGTPAETSYRGVFTPGTTTLPPHEPVRPAAPPPSSDPAEGESGQSEQAGAPASAPADAGQPG